MHHGDITNQCYLGLRSSPRQSCRHRQAGKLISASSRQSSKRSSGDRCLLDSLAVDHVPPARNESLASLARAGRMSLTGLGYCNRLSGRARDRLASSVGCACGYKRGGEEDRGCPRVTHGGSPRRGLRVARCEPRADGAPGRSRARRTQRCRARRRPRGCVDQCGGEAGLVGWDAGVGGGGDTDEHRTEAERHDHQARKQVGEVGAVDGDAGEPVEAAGARAAPRRR